MLTTYIPAISQLAEQTLIAYISSSLYNNGTGSLVDPATQWYTGVANNDVTGPAVLVAVNGAEEVYWNTRIFRLNCDISTRMIAYDSLTSSNNTNSSISLSGNIFSLFGQSELTCQGINALTTSLAAIQSQIKSNHNERVEDAWISNLNIDLIATIFSS